MKDYGEEAEVAKKHRVVASTLKKGDNSVDGCNRKNDMNEGVLLILGVHDLHF